MFSVYDITDLSTPDTMVWMQDNVPGATRFFERDSKNLEPSLMGLSLGEAQQVVMDYVRTDIRNDKCDKAFGTLYDIAEFESRERRDQLFRLPRTCATAEEFIYSLSPARMSGLWIFDTTSLYLKQE